MTITQALDVWGTTGWELVGMAAVPEEGKRSEGLHQESTLERWIVL
jgi:hypothetical protein